MKAMLYYVHGESDVLTWDDIPTPQPGEGEVLIAVRAVSVNHGPDVETRKTGFGMKGVELPHIGGVDPAGQIVQIGPGVDGWQLGDRVAVYPVIACGRCDFCLAGAAENYCRASHLFGTQTQGGRAEFVTAPATQLVRLPDTVSYEQAAALGVAYTTTWHGMFERARLTAADTLLVMGAGGACGVAAVQLGKMAGATVIAVTGDGWKQDRVRELGADHVFSYRDPEWQQGVLAATDGIGVSVAFDNVGASTLPLTIDVMARTGRLFCSGGTTGLDVTLNLRRLYRDHITLMFYVQGSKADMADLVALVADGKLDPIIDSVYSLSDAAAADDHLDAQQQFGRVLLRVSEDG